MINLSLNDHQLYYLRCLCQAVYEETGVWHQLHNTDEIIKLLRYSSMAPFELIYGYFCRFIKTLDKDDYSMLKAANILMPEDIDGSNDPHLYVV